MQSASGKLFRQRSERIQNEPGKFSGFVRYAQNGFRSETKPAQFADISDSGMRLISRQATEAKVGDYISVEFMLPGSQKRIINQARVVRKNNEFVFSVRFMGDDAKQKQLLTDAISQYLDFSKGQDRFFNHVRQWLNSNKRGLTIAVLGGIFAIAAGSMIYFNSDEHSGARLRAWGNIYPKEWSLNYYGKGNSAPSQPSHAK